MLGEVTLYAFIGLYLFLFGFLIWKKQMTSLLHYCHYKNVAKEDIPAYTRDMGIGLVVVAVGVWMTGILRIVGLPSQLSLSAAVLGIIIGVIIMSKAQMKYNGSWF